MNTENTEMDQDKAAKRPVAKNEKFAVWQRESNAPGRKGEIEFNIQEKQPGGETRYIGMRGQINGTALTAEQVLALMEGESVRVKGKSQTDGKTFIREVSLRNVKTVPGDEERRERHYATLGIASLRIGETDGIPSVFGYSLNARNEANEAIKVRFLQKAPVGEGHVELTSGDCWKLYDAGVGNPVQFDQQVELVLSKLDERKDDKGQVVLYAYVDGKEIAAEISESQDENHEEQLEEQPAGARVAS